MHDDKIDWCSKQQKGITLTEKKPHLALAYAKEAEASLQNSQAVEGIWKTVISYYACYHAFYALLMDCGIQSEIHDCTIALMPLLGFTAKDHDFMEQLKHDRIRTQYYLEEKPVPSTEAIKKFIVACGARRSSITAKEKEIIRAAITTRQR